MDTTVKASFEEKRLPNKLDAGDALSFSQQLLKASGFDRFGPEFALKLCKDGLAGASSYDEAITLVKAEGQKLWQAAVDRVQGRKVEGTLPKSDDRMLYWARLTMTLALRQWKPDFALDDTQRAALQHEFERASRGQYAIDFPEGAGHKRILVSGFDPFTLGTPGRDGNPNIRIGNPSGATILSLDGNTVALADGTTAVIRTFILPVNYSPFIQGMQEDTLGPWFKPSAKRVDASISMSQGGGAFHLEHFNGRNHYAAVPGNDDLKPACTEADRSLSGSGLPVISIGTGWSSELDCQIYPPARWFGRETRPWKRDDPPQFTQANLPFQSMIDAKTGTGIAVPPGPYDAEWGIPPKTNGWDVIRRDTYSVSEFCTRAAQAAKEAKQPVSPLEVNCAQSGGGGNYLSNASAYRNTLMRDVFNLQIPAGHIHTPVMTVFGSGSDDKITDATFEGTRDAIVAQGRNLVFAVAKSLASAPAP